MLEDLHRQTPEGRRHKLRTYANAGLLCIAEVGYLSFDDKAADLLYDAINRRYERKPVMLTTNRPFKEWNEVFPNATCIVTLLDRPPHHADVTVIEGDSYRVRESERETAARLGHIRGRGGYRLRRSSRHAVARRCPGSFPRPPASR